MLIIALTPYFFVQISLDPPPASPGQKINKLALTPYPPTWPSCKEEM